MSLRSQNKIKIEGGMSSMTDLVFLLLIFFIILSTMVTAGHSIDLPKSGPSSTTDKSITKVFVNKKNKIWIKNDEMKGPDNKPLDREISLEELRTTIMQYVDHKKTIELVGDKRSDWEYSVGVIDIAKQNELKIVIKTKP
jgi:biopolymer transport protein ExbD